MARHYRRLILFLALALWPAFAWAQCPPGTSGMQWTRNQSQDLQMPLFCVDRMGIVFPTQNFTGVLGNATSAIYAAAQTGLDCGAKINKADAVLGGQPGEIWIDDACGWFWTTAFNLSVNHVLRFLQGGEYWLNVGQTISATGVGIVGDGAWTTQIVVNFASGDVVNFTGSGGYVRDIRFLAAVTRTAGAYVHFNGVMPGLIQNFSTDGAFIGVQVTNSSTVRIQNGRMMNGAVT
jgi:hypothetical protein